MIRRSKVWLWFWMLLAGAICAVAQDPGPGAMSGPQTALYPGQAGDQPHTVRGTVVNSITGEPIYRAMVQVGGQFAALTDHEGHFEFAGVTENIVPWAMKPGYFAEHRFQRFSPVSAASQPESLVVKLVPESILSGTVLGGDGAPLEGIHVALKMLTVSDGLVRWTQRQGTTTNSEGKYRFFELETGKYAVVTGFHTEGLQDAESSVAYVPARYPATTGTGAEAAIVLGPGEHREADLNPAVEKVYPVTGTVSGYGESRGVSFRVQTANGEEIVPSARFMARTGEFRLMLPGGSYQVTATAYQRGARQRQQLEARREVNVPQGPVGGISFSLEPAATIPVEVSVEAVNQSSSGSGQDAGQAPRPMIMLINTDANTSNGFLGAQPVQQGGEQNPSSAPAPATIENVPPGRYILQVEAGYPWYVSSASCGGVDLLREELSIGGGAAGCSIRVTMRNDFGIVHVTFHDPGTEGQPGLSNGEGPVVYVLPVGELARQPFITSGWGHLPLCNFNPFSI